VSADRSGDRLEQLVAQLEGRLRRYREHDDSDAVLSPDALEQVGELLMLGPTKVAAHQLAGWLNYYRYYALGGQERERIIALAEALMHFQLLYVGRPQLLPPDVRDYFDTNPSTADDLTAPPRQAAINLLELARGSDDLAALKHATTLLEELTASYAQHPFNAADLSNLAIAYMTNFERSGHQPDLDRAIDTLQASIEATDKHDRERVQRWDLLSALLHERFKRTNRREDIDRAITAHGHALAEIGPDDPRRGRLLAKLATAQWKRFELTDEADDLDAAINNGRQAVGASAGDERAGCLSDLGVWLRMRNERNHDRTDLDSAITLTEQALAAEDLDERDRAGCLANLAAALKSRFEQTLDVADLDAAVRTGEQAVAASPRDDPNRARWQSNLALFLRIRFDQTGRQADLDAAISAALSAHEQGFGVADVAADWAPLLHDLSQALRSRFERSKSIRDIDRAIEIAVLAVAASAAEDPDLAERLSGLSLAHWARHELTADPADLEQTIAAAHRAVIAGEPNHPHLGAYLSNLALALGARSDPRQGPADLDAAITARKRALDETNDAAGRGRHLFALAVSYWKRYELTQHGADLDDAISAGDEAVTLMAPDDPDRCGALSNLGVALRARFEQAGNGDDLTNAISFGRESVEAAGKQHPQRAGYLSNLALALSRLVELTGKPEHRAQVVDMWHQAVAASDFSDPDRSFRRGNLTASRAGELSQLDAAINSAEQTAASTKADVAQLATLADLLIERFGLSGRLAELDRAITAREQAVAATPAADAPLHQFNLGYALLVRFELGGREPGNLDAAITELEHASTITDPDDATLPHRLTVLADALCQRSELTNQPADLDRAVELGEQAVAARPDHADQAVHLRMLALCYWRRFQRTGRQPDLNHAVTLGEQSLSAAGENVEQRSLTLTNLGFALWDRFERTGQPDDGDQAIARLEEAVLATAAWDHPDPGAPLSNLALALRRRFERTGRSADLHQALTLLHQALSLTDTADPRRPERESNLAIALLARFELLGAPRDIDRAIDLFQQAADATPERHRTRVARLSNLASAFLTRFEHLRAARADLDRTVALLDEALGITDPQQADSAALSLNLANALRARFRLERDPRDLQRAIATGEQAVKAAPADHPARGRVLASLADTFIDRYRATNETADLDRALRLSEDAATIATEPAPERARHAYTWGQRAAEAKRWESALRGFSIAVGLQNQVAHRSLTRPDQQRLLRDLAGVGANAAACALQLGQVERAVTLWEQGRGVLLGQLLDIRSEFSDLAAEHPQLAGRFIELRDQLDRPHAVDTTAAGERPTRRAARERENTNLARERAEQFDRLLADIRAKGFLKPPSIDRLRAVATSGPLVLLNITAIRSDALIVTPIAVEHVELPSADIGTVQHRVDQFAVALSTLADREASAAARSDAEQTLIDILGWLWDAITAPVLDRLRLEPSDNGEPLTRLWWLPSGPLSFLPLHAAGHHIGATGTRHSALNTVISSYAPTIRALMHTRRQTSDVASEANQLLVCAMTRTPGATPLAGAASEAADLRARFDKDARLLADHAATYASVTDAVPHYRWAHFACHGVSDTDDPSVSRLLLDDHETRPLTVLDLSRLELPHAELAFLSACSTARPAHDLPDEALHLAAACQLAGYRHVIGTLWPIGDHDAPAFANAIYATLPRRSPAGDVATAVHRATQAARARFPRAPQRWATHVHYGP
jgi:hypothetical protein